MIIIPIIMMGEIVEPAAMGKKAAIAITEIVTGNFSEAKEDGIQCRPLIFCFFKFPLDKRLCQ